MKWALGLLALALVAVVVAFVLAVDSTRDPVPGRLRACATDGGAGVVRGEIDLGAQPRSDIGAGALRVRARRQVGEDTAVLLDGTRYRLLVVAGRGSPPLTGDLGRRIYDSAAQYALVAKEVDPVRGVLGDCIALVSGR